MPAAPPPRPTSGEPGRAGVHPRPTRHIPPSSRADASNDGQISAGYQTAQVGFGAGAGITTPLNGSGYAPIGTSANFRRRRRRYMLYVRRSARARQTARSLGAARAAMAVAVAIAVLVTVVTSGAVSAAAGYYQVRAADIAALNRTVAAKDSVRIYDANGVLLYEFADSGVQHSIRWRRYRSASSMRPSPSKIIPSGRTRASTSPPSSARPTPISCSTASARAAARSRSSSSSRMCSIATTPSSARLKEAILAYRDDDSGRLIPSVRSRDVSRTRFPMARRPTASTRRRAPTLATPTTSDRRVRRAASRSRAGVDAGRASRRTRT